MNNILQEINTSDSLIEDKVDEYKHLHVDSSLDADLLMIKIDEYEKEIQEVLDLCVAEMEYLKYWKELRINKLTDGLNWYKQNLEIWMIQSEKKSVNLPHGKAYYRKQPFKVEVVDENQIIKSGFTRITTHVDKKMLMDHFKKTGEVVEGCEMIKPDEKFYVKVNSQYKGDMDG